jgi:hypothetical protein
MKLKSKLSKTASLCRLMPYLLVCNIRTNNLRKQIEQKITLSCNTFKLINSNQSNKFYIISPSAKQQGKLQATFFYNNIPYSDMIHDTYEQIIIEMSNDGYTTIEEAI